MAAQQQSNLDKKTPWIFFLNIFSQSFGIQVTLIFMNMFMTNFLLMAPMVVASILTVGRLVDLFVSMIAGSVVQKGNLKTGPYRTWILVNGPLLAIGNFLIFLNPNVGDTAKLVIFVIGYLFRNLPQSFLIAAQNALVGKVAGTNMNDRLTLTSRNIQGTQTAAIVTSALTVPLVNYFNATVGNGRGYLIVAMIYCAFQTALQVLVYFQLAPFDQYDPNLKKVEGSSVNVKVTHMYGDTFSNPQVWILTLAGVLAQIAMFTLSPLNAYFYTYCIGDITKMAYVNTTGAFIALGVAIVSPVIARKLGKKNSFVVSYIATTLGYLGITLFAKGNFAIFFAFIIWNRIVIGPSGSVGINLWLDAAEYQLHKTGRDSRPFIMSLNSITMKVGQMISSYTYAWVLMFCNFQTLGPGQVSLDADKLHVGLYGLLTVCYGLIAVLYMMFGISEEKAKEYAEANKKMLEERTAAAVAQPKN